MIWVSGIILAILGIAAVLELAARLLQLKSLMQAPVAPAAKDTFARPISAAPFVSVHVATYNEPPGLVIATLNALADSLYTDFEVVVVDNNTDDPDLWAPVASAISALGPRFRFTHVDRLQGAKAGALNLALSLSDPRTTHVAIVDADYQVHREFLADAVRSLTGAGVDYVQFPQAYRGVGRGARGVEHELGDYFACFSSGAGRPGSMLPTGTLSLFTLSALKAVGGWPTETITEDAEIGVRLQAAGCKGLWLARTRGRGILPVDLRGLRKQRARWAAGNLQVLKRLHRFDWLGLRFSDLVNLIVQLTSWISLLLPAALGLVWAAVTPGLPLSGAVAGLSAFTILASAALTGLRIIVFSAPDVAWSVRLEAFAAKTALTWTSAVTWVPALIPRPLRFHRTPKALGAANQDSEPVLGVVSLAFMGVGGAYALRGRPMEAAAALLLASIWVCARVVDAGLRRAAALNPELCG